MNTFLAQATEYRLLTPLPIGPGGAEASTTTFATYIPGIFNLMIGIAAVLAVIMIIYGGILYMSTDAISGKSDARSKIENALWGLILAISAWLILHTINPKLVTFNLNIDRIEIKDANPDLTPEQIKEACPNCLSLVGIPTTGSAVGKSVDSAFRLKLQSLRDKLTSLKPGEGLKWSVTEGFPPSSEHASPCHNNGTCVDANVSVPTFPNIKRFLLAAQESGLDASYEVLNPAQLESARKAGIPTSSTCSGNGTACVNPAATAPHFHIK